jgi:hypothetical protein
VPLRVVAQASSLLTLTRFPLASADVSAGSFATPLAAIFGPSMRERDEERGAASRDRLATNVADELAGTSRREPWRSTPSPGKSAQRLSLPRSPPSPRTAPSSHASADVHSPQSPCWVPPPVGSPLSHRSPGLQQGDDPLMRLFDDPSHLIVDHLVASRSVARGGAAELTEEPGRSANNRVRSR